MKRILVVGPPRSGTSVTGRILHERLGVCMGHNLVPGNAGNPLGFYEDFKYTDIIKRRKHAELFAALDHGCEVVGVKSPELCHMSFEHLSADLVIVTTRGLVRNATSLSRWHQPAINYDEAAQRVKDYQEAIELELVHSRVKHWRIDLTDFREEDDIQRELKTALSL